MYFSVMFFFCYQAPNSVGSHSGQFSLHYSGQFSLHLSHQDSV